MNLALSRYYVIIDERKKKDERKLVIYAPSIVLRCFIALDVEAEATRGEAEVDKTSYAIKYQNTIRVAYNNAISRRKIPLSKPKHDNMKIQIF